MLEIIKAGDQSIAFIIYSNFRDHGIHFFTPNEYSQQLAYMNRPAGYTIQPHIHNPVKREVHYTKEVLIMVHPTKAYFVS